MVIRTFFDRNNTIIYNDLTNTGRNPITELFYGGKEGETMYSRSLFHFDETRLRELYADKSFADLSKLTHTLKLTNTGAFDTDLLGTATCDGKNRACSFDLIAFEINQEWDEGVGYDYGECRYIGGSTSTSICPSNWTDAQTNILWSGGNGVYSGSPSGITVATQHFERGNEDVEMDVTDFVNAIITGDTNYGLGLAYARTYEETLTNELQYVGFFTRHTQTFFEPHLETTYDCPIIDDRNDFILDKNNKLYLYVNVGGQPTNVDELSAMTVTVRDNSDVVFSSYTSSAITQVTKGVYCIDIKVPTTADYDDCTMFTDTWSGVTINGVNRPAIELDFALKDSGKYYNIGDSAELPRKFGFNVTGIKSGEKILRGDLRKIITTARIPYTVNQSEVIDGLEYRIYVKEGPNEYTVVDFRDVERTANLNYFLLDTESLIPNTYYLDLKVSSNLEVTTMKNVINFDIVGQSELRNNN
jgi:hypothetical protein